MQYIHLKITPENTSQEMNDILIARLSEWPFESFSENEEGISAYIPLINYNEKSINQLLESLKRDFPLSWTKEQIAEQNWNKAWEDNYSPVLVAQQVYVRAPFHEPLPDAGHEIIIEPKMSFGTAHHETTQLMIELMLDTDFHGKTFLDMGCGTGILAILASRLSAERGLAIDNDEWAFQNSRENLLKNAIKNVDTLPGDHQLINHKNFDIILANINRNILLEQMESFAKSLNPGGSIFLSGFHEEDVQMLLERSRNYGFRLKRKAIRNTWVAMEIFR